MRNSRLVTTAAVAVLSLALTAAAAAMRAPVEDGTLSVRDGKGTVIVRIKGGVIGRIARGKLTVTDSLHDSEVEVVRGAERSRDLNARTTMYSGTNIRFRISDERRFVVKLEGNKINLSAVGRGEVVLDGKGDAADDVFFDGTYSLNGSEYKSLPDERERFELASSPSSSG